MADASYQQCGDPRIGATVATAFTGEFVSAGTILYGDGYAPDETAFALKLSLPRTRGSSHATAADPENASCSAGVTAFVL